MDDVATSVAVTADRWLLLIHQLPAKPAYLRVKVWRRLQALGAVAVKKCGLRAPGFEWVLKEITEGGGEASRLEMKALRYCTALYGFGDYSGAAMPRQATAFRRASSWDVQRRQTAHPLECRFGVKLRNTQHGQMSSALPSSSSLKNGR
jgi:hypothetical protein